MQMFMGSGSLFPMVAFSVIDLILLLTREIIVWQELDKKCGHTHATNAWHSTEVPTKQSVGSY
jgi:hypothetical protein